MATVYVTTANYALDVAITANNIATVANNYINSISNTQITIDQISNIAQAALSNSIAANSNASIANALATSAFSISTNAYSLASNANTLAFNANALASNAYFYAKYANDFISNGLVANVNSAYSNAAIANILSTNAFSISTNAYALASNANIIAFNANALATNAYALASNANSLAVSTNNFITQINVYANDVFSVYSNILSNGYSFWSNGVSTTYIMKNVAIGSNVASNALDVVGNVYISGNLYIGGAGGTNIVTPSTSGLFKFDSDVVLVPKGPKGETIVPFSTMSNFGLSKLTPQSNSLLFQNIGVYSVTLCIQGYNADSNYDTLASVNVYTNTTDTMTGAALVYSDSSSVTFGPIKQNLVVPLSVLNSSNSYIFGINFFRTNAGTTIKGGDFNASYVQVCPLMGAGIPVYPTNIPSAFTQNYDGLGNPLVGVNKVNPSFTLDVNGKVNSLGVTINGSDYLTSIQNGVFVSQNTTYNKDITVNGNVNSTYMFGNIYYATGKTFNFGTGNIFTYSNVGIGTQFVSNALDVRGQVYVNGNVTAKYFLGDITKSIGYYYPFSQWLLGTGNVWTLSNIGIGTSAVSNTLTVNGNISANYLYANIFYAKGFTNSPFFPGTNNSYSVSNIGIGTSAVSNTLTVNGNISANYLFANTYYCPGLFNLGTTNIFTNSNVVIGTPSVGNALTVYGNAYISGTLKTESTFILICTSTNDATPITTSIPIMTFRNPGPWILTRVPRITLTTPPSTGYVNVNVSVESTSILSSNVYITGSGYSSTTSTQPTLLNPYIPDDSAIKINLHRADGNPTGLKVIFYYMNV